MERLCDVVICPGTKGDHPAVVVVEGGDDDDRGEQEMRVRAQDSAQFEAVRLRHHEVEQEKVRFDGERHPVRLGTVVLGRYFKTLHPKKFSKEGCNLGVVVHDHDFCHRDLFPGQLGDYCFGETMK
jgi:hypothetical protein